MIIINVFENTVLGLKELRGYMETHYQAHPNWNKANRALQDAEEDAQGPRPDEAGVRIAIKRALGYVTDVPPADTDDRSVRAGGNIIGSVINTGGGSKRY